MLIEKVSNRHALNAAVESVAARLDNAKKPVLLGGPHLRSFGAMDAFRELAEALGCAVAVMPAVKGFFPEDHPQYIGIYMGGASSPDCEPIVDWADLILAAGPQFTDYTTEGWTALPPREKLITAEPRSVQLSDLQYTGTELADFLSALARKVRRNDTTLIEYRRIGGGKTATGQTTKADSNTPLTRAEMVRQIEKDLDGQTTLLVETGDAWFHGMYMRLPKDSRFEIEMQWGSIGWAVPASFGYAMGMEPGRRLVSIIGDGSFQFLFYKITYYQ